MSVSHRGRLATALVVVIGMLPTVPAVALDNPSSGVFINEIHYDNASTDTGEAIEVAGPSGTDLTGWSIFFYNGNGGASYGNVSLAGSIDDEGGGFGAVAVDFAGVQNGSPDGLALVDATGAVVQFLSYEGTFVAVGGPADGLTSTDIGVSQSGSGPVGESLFLEGSGFTYGDFSWTSGTSSLGIINTGQAFSDEPPEEADPWINELHYDNSGTDAGEAVEIAGEAGIDLAGWSVVFYNGATGASYDEVALTGSIDDEGAGFGAVSVDVAGIQNGEPDGLALVDDAGSVIQFLSYEGTLTAIDGPAAGLTSTDIGASQGSEPAGVSLQLTGAGTAYADFTWNSAAATFGCVNVGQVDLGTSTCGAVETTLISAIQGAGDVSPLLGQRVEVAGVVVGDYEGPSPALRGFYVQEEESDWDADPATSEGLFVFHGDEDGVSVGDVVRVVGTVAEFQGQTQLGFPEQLEVVSSDASVPATPIELPFPSVDHPERYEGMTVTVPETLFVTEFFQLGRFGEVVVSGSDRLQQPTAVAEPGAAAIAVQLANDLNRLVLDDTTNTQNPDPIAFGRNGEPLTAANTLRGGDTVTGATGVMTYTWAGNSASGNAYRLRPPDNSSVFQFEAQNPRPTAAPNVGGSLKVASFNVLNYFLTLDADGNLCGVVPTECRGAESAFEFERQRTKLLAALEQVNADVFGFMELENTPGVSPEADIAQGLNDLLGGGAYAAVDAGTVGDDVIRVGLIYKPGSVMPIGDPMIVDFGDGLNRAALTQTFREVATGEVFSVAINHFKSKGCTDATGSNLDQGDGQGCWNPARVAAATELVAALDSLGGGDDDWLIIGDLNSYDYEDPIDVIKAAGYVDLALEYHGDETYSYVFDGQWGYLDYALASPSLAAQVNGMSEYHINSDEPSVLDYNTNFKSAAQIDYLFAPDEYRTSDHDPVVVGLALDSDLPGLGATPESLWPPNHKHRTVHLQAGGAEVDVVAVTSSEADSGLGGDDRPNDIVIVNADTLRLRAERYSQSGRVYTIEATVSDQGQVRYDTVEVRVPHDRGHGPGSHR